MIDEEGKIKENNSTDLTPEIVSSNLHARIAYFTGSITGNISNVCIDKNALNRVGLFNETMRISADFDMWVRLAREHDTGFIRQKLIQLRDHGGQLSRNENYYLDHVKEDLQVYRFLNSYVAAPIQQEGRYLLRNHKLVFYYTLMMKAFIKGQINTARAYFRELSGFENMAFLTISFLKSKVKGPNKINLFEDQ
jgi:hypothetical protein